MAGTLEVPTTFFYKSLLILVWFRLLRRLRNDKKGKVFYNIYCYFFETEKNKNGFTNKSTLFVKPFFSLKKTFF